MTQRTFPLLLLVLLLMVSVPAHAQEDGFSASIAIVPEALAAPAAVRVAITIYNGSARAADVTLQDPSGAAVPEFGADGTASLQPGHSAAYNGVWQVTQAQLEAGKVVYIVQFASADDRGRVDVAQRPVAAGLTRLAAAADSAGGVLRVERHVSPFEGAAPGDVVTLRYVLSNIGEQALAYVQIDDPELIARPAMHAPLLPGDTTELAYRYTMTDQEITTSATLTYQVEGDSVPVTTSVAPALVLTPAR